MQLELLVMTVFLLMLQDFGNKIQLTMLILLLPVNIAISGMNGINISFGVMKDRMKIKLWVLLLMEFKVRLINGLVIGCLLENGVLQRILKPLLMIETNLNNWLQN